MHVAALSIPFKDIFQRTDINAGIKHPVTPICVQIFVGDPSVSTQCITLLLCALIPLGFPQKYICSILFKDNINLFNHNDKIRTRLFVVFRIKAMTT